MPHLFSGTARGVFEFVEGDIGRFETPKTSYTHLIHAATPVDPQLMRDNPDEMRRILIEGSSRIAEFAAKTNVRRLLFTSSGAVYGSHPEATSGLSENLVCRPTNVYGEGKLEAERILTAHGEKFGFATLLARCFAFLGPHLPLEGPSAAGQFLKSAATSNEIQAASDGRAIRSYMYPADLVIWLLRILVSGEHGRPYNVGSADPVSIRQLAETIANEWRDDHPVTVKFAEGKGSGLASDVYVPNVDRARNELGARTSTDLAEAVHKTRLWLC